MSESSPICRAARAVLSAAAVALAAPAVAGVNGGPVPRKVAADPFEALTDLPASVSTRTATVRPQRYAAARAPLAGVRAALAVVEPEPRDAPGSVATVFMLPGPDGQPQAFAVYVTQLMEPDLAAQLPGVRTYIGVGLDDPAASLRMTTTDAGLTAQVLTPRGSWYVDPAVRGDAGVYVSYRKSDLKPLAMRACQAAAAGPEEELFRLDAASVLGGAGALGASGATLRTYRAAIAATGEYTDHFGGVVANAQAQIVATMNRVVGIYERDLTIRMTLVNNATIVYADPATDPYTDPANAAQMLTQNQTAIDGAIGNSQYNIGHVFSVSSTRMATPRVVCRTGQKARAVSGLPDPTGDAFAVEIVAHEMGHQFGANHTFNGVGGSCAAGRNQATSFEPGAGSTIMSFAGLCGTDDVQTAVSDYFHTASIDEIQAYVLTVACQTNAATGNAIPDVVTTSPEMVPRETPFTLSAMAFDGNSADVVTYCWEQRDAGGASGEALSPVDSGVGPLFRSFPPTISGSRTFPQLAVILNNANVSEVEKLPTVARTLNFRATVRDNRAGGGAVNTVDATVQVVGTAGPFRVVFPNDDSAVMVGSQGVSWLTSGTSAAPINADFVNIRLSTDGGLTFPTLLATGVPNNGSAMVVFPSISTDNGRIRVEASGHIFFDASDADFRVRPPVAGVSLAGIGLDNFDDTQPDGNGNGRIDPGESAIGVNVSVINRGSTEATGVVGTLESLTATVSVVAPGAAYPDLSFNEAAFNAAPFVIAVDPSHVCGAPISLRLHVDSDQNMPGQYDFVFTTGQSGNLSSPVVTNYAGPPVPIPDRAAGVDGEVSIPFSVAGVGAIGTIDFGFGGSSCNTDVGSETVGLDHSWPGDLEITLISPGGVEVILAQNPGPAPLGTSGHNLCNTFFVQGGGVPSIQNVTSADAPYTDAYAPFQSFNALVGLNGSGTWTLRIRDTQQVDIGSVRKFTLTLRTQLGITCNAPGPPACDLDYNVDTVVNPDDLGDYITDYYTDPPIPGPGGYAVACPENEAPYDQGYKAAYVPGGSQCNEPFPDNLGDFITDYFIGC
ncbi:MAG: reprolysin-like metallopeptidase [Phycisphaerales bacterium]